MPWAQKWITSNPESDTWKAGQLLVTLALVEEFDNSHGIDTLKSVLNIDENNYRNPVTSPVCDELDPQKTNDAIRYKILTMAKALTSTSNNGFNYGTQFVISSGLDSKLSAEASVLIVPLYRAHLENGLVEHAPSVGGKPLMFLPLFNDIGFCRAYADLVLDPDFINEQLIAVTLSSNRDYVRHVAYLYERMRKTLSTAPSGGGMIRAMTLPVVSTKSAQAHWTPIVKENAQFKDEASLNAFLVDALPLVWSNESDLQGPSFPSLGQSFNNQWIQRPDWVKVAQATVNAQTINETFSLAWRPGQPITIDTVYGNDLVQWINSLVASGYRDVFRGGNPHHVITRLRTNGGPSGHVPGTLIRTAAGNKPIENLQSGDSVLTKASSRHGILSDEQVKLPTGSSDSPETKILVCGINDEPPFFTPGHVFVTKAGLKAVRPELSLVDSPDITVHELVPGDVLFQLEEKNGKLDYAQVTVNSINKSLIDCPYVHGLHFRRSEDGGWTYHANGYLVAGNYPEITLDRLRRNFAALSTKEQRDVPSAINRIPQSVKSIFGTGVFDVFQAEFSNGGPQSELSVYLDKNMARRRENMKKRRVDSASSIKTFSLVHFSNVCNMKTSLCNTATDFADQVSKVNGALEFPLVSISEGVVLVNDKLVAHARVSSSLIEWSRPLDEKTPGLWEHGALHVSGDGSVAHGAVGQSHVEDASIPVTEVSGQLAGISRVFGISHANDYYPLSTQAGPSGPGTFSSVGDADGVSYPGNLVWNHFHKVEIGLSVDNNHNVKVVVNLPDLDRNWGRPDVPLYSSVAAASTEFITISVTATEGFQDLLSDLLTPDSWVPEHGRETNGVPPAFHSFVFKIQRALNIATGHYYELQPDPELPGRWVPGPIHAIYCPHSPKVTELKSRALMNVARSPSPVGDGVPLALKADRHDPSTNIHHPALSVTSKLAALAGAQDNLPVSFLQTMSTPPDIDLHSHSQDYMLAAAAYWRGSDEVSLFGDEKAGMATILPDSLKDQLAGSLQTFLTNHFSKSLLLHGLSTSATYASKFDSSRADKLDFWWKGKAPQCLSQFKEFNDVTVITSAVAFKDLATATDSAGHTFQAYVNSTTDYASLLFGAVTDDDVLNNLAFGVVLGDQNLVNRYCTILNALDKKNRALDTQLWSLVREKAFLQAANASPEFGDDWSEVAQAYMKDLAERVANNDPAIQDDLRKEMAIDIDSLKQTLEAEDDADLAFKMFSEQSAFGGNILSAIDFFKRRPTSGGQLQMPAFFKKLKEKASGPIMSKVYGLSKTFIVLGMQVYTIWASVKYFMAWDSLRPDQKAAAVLTVIEAGLRSIHELVNVWKAIKNLPEDSLDFRINCYKWNKGAGNRVTVPDDQGIEMDVFNDRSMADVPRVNEELPGGIDPAIPERSVAQQVAEAGRTMEPGAAATMKTKFSFSSAVVEGVMVAVNIAIAVELGIEIKNEWGRVPDGIKAMDIINLYIQYLQIVTGVAEVTLMIVGESLAALPGVGVLVMAAGLIMMLVEAFVPRPKPDPIGDYLDNHGWNFIDPLDPSPQPQLVYSATLTPLANGRLALHIQVSQPAGLTPAPEISQLLVKIYAGREATDLFLPPTLDVNGKVVKDDIIWSIVDNPAFQANGGNNPDPNNHSIIGSVTPTTPATSTPASANHPASQDPGTSVLGSAILDIRIEGTSNGVAGTTSGQVTEVLFNERQGVFGTDVVWKFSLPK